MSVQNNRTNGQRILCLGFDPLPRSGLQKDWLGCVENHFEMFELLKTKPAWVKINLAFFIRWGRLGIDKLELACEMLSGRASILLDGKFGEIGNSLNQYLDFAFDHLRVDGVTINPFMGEHVIGSSLQKAVTLRGARARVFVLGATSEFPQKRLSKLQNSLAEIAETCTDAHLALDSTGALAPHIGLVIGANRTDALSNPKIRDSKLPLLMPGVGAQGVALKQAILQTHGFEQDVLLPISRAICEGGNLKPVEMQEKFESAQADLESLLNNPRSLS